MDDTRHELLVVLDACGFSRGHDHGDCDAVDCFAHRHCCPADSSCCWADMAVDSEVDSAVVAHKHSLAAGHTRAADIQAVPAEEAVDPVVEDMVVWNKVAVDLAVLADQADRVGSIQADYTADSKEGQEEARASRVVVEEHMGHTLVGEEEEHRRLHILAADMVATDREVADMVVVVVDKVVQQREAVPAEVLGEDGDGNNV